MDSKYIITQTGNFISTDELYHWGVKGMKWGVRRYQNPDGSLTAAGRKRYTNPDGSLNEKGKKKFGDSVKTNIQTMKSVKDMSDEDLDKAINRARKEDEYNRLRPDTAKDSGGRSNKSIMNKLVNDMIVPAVVNSGRNALQKALDKVASKALDGKVDPNSYEALKKKYDTLKMKKDIERLQKGTLSMDDISKEYSLRKSLMNDIGADSKKQAEEAKKILRRLGWDDA